MMSLGIGCSTAETRKCGFLGHYKGCFLVRGWGWGPRSGLFPRARYNSCKEVGVLGRRRGVMLKKRNGVKAFGPGAELWACTS